MKKLLAVLLLMMILAAGAAADVMYIDGIDADRVHLRAEPDMESESLGLYYTGTQVTSFPDDEEARSAGFTKVSIGTAYLYNFGYIKSEYLRSDPSEVENAFFEGAASTNAGYVNLRSQTGVSEILAAVPNGEHVTVMGETSNGWYYVQYEDKIGYMQMNLVDRVKTETTDETQENAQPQADAEKQRVPLFSAADPSGVRSYIYGGSEQDALYDIAASSDGRIVMTGFTQSSDGTLADRTKTGRSGWALCVDNSGEVLWSFCTRLGTHDTLRQPRFHEDGSVTVVLEAEPDGGQKLEIIRLDREGNVVTREGIFETNPDSPYVSLETVHMEDGCAISYTMSGSNELHYQVFGWDGELRGVLDDFEQNGRMDAAAESHFIRIEDRKGWLVAADEANGQTRLAEVFSVADSGLVSGRYTGLVSLADGGAAGSGWVMTEKDGERRYQGCITRWDASGGLVFDMWMANGMLKEIVKTEGGFASLHYPEETEETLFSSELEWDVIFFDEAGIMRRTVPLGLASRDDCTMTALEDGSIAVVQRIWEEGEDPKGDVRLTIILAK